jgi:TRAP-type C4-dicarboxylate transport system permease small subunit
MVKAIVRFFNLVHIFLVYVAEILLIAMVLIIFANVTLRYVFNSGLNWSEEIALLIAVWFSFIAMGLGVKEKLHIHINLLDERHIPPKLNGFLWKIRDMVVLVVGVAMIYYGWVLVGFTMRSIMPATGLPAGLLYLVLPIAAIILIYEGITDLIGVDTEDQLVDDYLQGKVPLRAVLTGGHNGGDLHG